MSDRFVKSTTAANMRTEPLFYILCALFPSTFAWQPNGSKQRSVPTTNEESLPRRKIFESVVGSIFLLSIPEATRAVEEQPMWLSEPTEEFKENERKAMEFRKAQLAVKQKFVGALNKLSDERNDEAALRSDMEDLQRLVIQTKGLPLGIKKQDMFKQIRAKKAKGFWPTSVEIA